MNVYGMLWIAHGSRDSAWVNALDEAWMSVRAKWTGPAFLSFLELVDGRLIQDGIDALEAAGVTDMIVVPIFVSSGSTHSEEIAWALGVIPEPLNETDLEKFRVNARVHWCEPMNDATQLMHMVTQNVSEISEAPQQEALLIVGHGSKQRVFQQAWQAQLDLVAAQMKSAFGFATVETAMLLPDTLRNRVARVQEQWLGLRVLVVPLFISPGYYTRKAIPERLNGLEYRYNGKTLLPNVLVADWALEQALMRRAREENEYETGAFNL